MRGRRRGVPALSGSARRGVNLRASTREHQSNVGMATMHGAYGAGASRARRIDALACSAANGYSQPMSSTSTSTRAESPWHEELDVVIIGGGPGGATAGALLAQRGRRVAVLERQRFPRFHIGESLLPSSAPVLAMLGLSEEMDRRFVRKYSARFLDDEANHDAPAATARYGFDGAFPPAIPFAWQVTRAEFDEMLLRRAGALGADIREGWRVERPIFEGGAAVGVEATGPDGETRRIGARVVIDASGRDSLLTPAAGRKRIAGLDKTAIFTNLRGGHRNEGVDVGQIELTILAGSNADGSTPGWAWFIPFLDGTTSVGFVLSSAALGARMRDAREVLGADPGPTPREYTPRSEANNARLEQVFDEVLASSPWMSRLCAGAPRIESVRAAADYSFRVEKLAGDGWIVLGDAAGFLDPLFSTGAHLAMGGAVRAVAAIDEGLTANDVSAARFAPYAKELRAAADLFLGAVQSFYRGELRGLLFAQEQRATLRRMITSMLAGDVFHDTPARWHGYFADRFPVRL
jgi:flavin-dependent dehydrogenase